MFSGTGYRGSLAGTDPLYGKVIVELSGSYLFGAIRLKDTSAFIPVMDEMKKRALGKANRK